jgi:hypothetical protein
LDRDSSQSRHVPDTSATRIVVREENSSTGLTAANAPEATAVRTETENEDLEGDLDAEQLQGQLSEWYEPLVEETAHLSYTELLLGSWDGFDMRNALFQADPSAEVVAPGMAVHNTSSEVRAPVDVNVDALLARVWDDGF